MRTLVISDLHLGNWAHHDVLRRPEARARLFEALEGFDRLVLLGDLAELMNRHGRRSLEVAEPVLRELGRRLGPHREVIIVPGNHDAPLVRAWVRAQGPRLTPDATVEPGVTPALARVVSWLAPAPVQVRYPGVWLADRIWATHGHYLDRHLMPESTFGVLRPEGRDRRWAGALPFDYERPRGRSRRTRESGCARWLDRSLATLLEGASELVRTQAVPRLPRLLMDARLAPLTAAMIDFQMRHASIPAMARVARRLGIDADWVVFGHVHRVGPAPVDRVDDWRAPAGSLRLINTGSWLYEPLLIDRAQPPHAYWPGGAVVLEPGHEPRAIGLLDGLTAAELGPSD